MVLVSFAVSRTVVDKPQLLIDFVRRFRQVVTCGDEAPLQSERRQQLDNA